MKIFLPVLFLLGFTYALQAQTVELPVEVKDIKPFKEGRQVLRGMSAKQLIDFSNYANYKAKAFGNYLKILSKRDISLQRKELAAQLLLKMFADYEELSITVQDSVLADYPHLLLLERYIEQVRRLPYSTYASIDKKQAPQYFSTKNNSKTVNIVQYYIYPSRNEGRRKVSEKRLLVYFVYDYKLMKNQLVKRPQLKLGEIQFLQK